MLFQIKVCKYNIKLVNLLALFFGGGGGLALFFTILPNMWVEINYKVMKYYFYSNYTHMCIVGTAVSCQFDIEINSVPVFQLPSHGVIILPYCGSIQGQLRTRCYRFNYVHFYSRLFNLLNSKRLIKR